MTRLAAQRLQMQRTADLARHGQAGRQAEGDPGRDVVAVVADLQQPEAVVGAGDVLRGPDPALDHQRVIAAEAQPGQVQVAEIRRADDLAAVGVKQPPGEPVAAAGAQALPVQVIAGTGCGGEAVDIGFVRRIEGAADNGVAGQRGGAGHIEQAEGKRPLLVAFRVDDQLVVTGDQVQQRAGAAEFLRLRVIQLAAADLGAARAGQAPAEIRGVVVGYQRVEQQ